MTYAPDSVTPVRPAASAPRGQPTSPSPTEPSSTGPAPTGPSPTGLLRRLGVGQKVLLSSLVLGLPLLGTGLLLTQGARQDQQRAVRAAEMTEYYTRLQKMQSELAALRASGATTLSASRLEALEQAARGLDTDEHFGDESRTLAEAVQTQVRALSAALKSGSLTRNQLSRRTTELLDGDLAELFHKPARDGGLLTTSSYEAHSLATLTSDVLPGRYAALQGNAHNLSQLFSRVQATQGGVLSSAQREEAEQYLTQGRSALEELGHDVEERLADLPEAQAELAPLLERALSQTQALFTTYAQQLERPRLTDVASLRGAEETALRPQYGAFQAMTEHMAEHFGESQRAATRRLNLLLGGLAALLVLVALVNRSLRRSILHPLRQLTSASEQLARGNLAVHLPVNSNDEFGTLATSFNAAASELRANAARVEQERHEAQQLQNNIGQFLDVTMDIAEGDLTKRGKVTEDVLGNVVDSINLMTEELAATLRQVQDASASVSGGSRQMLGTTEAIQQGAQLTASEAQRVAEQVRLITATIREMAHNAQTSAQTAREALLASQQGQEALQETLGGMQNIRREVQQVSRRIKTLGDRSLEIQEIVDTISQIARRTNLLALNASVEAAGAGDVGGRFGAVADEIRQLAATSAQATTRIAGLIRSVQAEVQDVIVGAEEGTREVEQGYRIAGSAGQRLQDIGQLTERSAQLAEQIAASTQAQVSSVEQVNAAVQQIAEVAQRSESAVEQGRSAAQRLEDLAQQLNASLARFRLPG
ncbi:methyl-accepting chemotaxis protein [Deinococcus wulumuqiensis]|uniref:methyl-accepting chemotaxis protein n=14 Tax=Deinococcus wulumuqiensis TaxID=980427 RepID=UPI0013EA3F9A|nr:methyl-accepting chemotaxis protein [Deinococcus wulumuqiensis]QII22137.1 methyl-accepting chemotaxis protein [Deinococcus wulumuqiensis R12]